MTLPLGIAAAVHLEEFADRKRWFNRFVELNVQNLAAVPSIVYGLLALAFLSMLGVTNKNIVIGGALALTLLILPVIIIATREALRAVPARSAMGRWRWGPHSGRRLGGRCCRRRSRVSPPAQSSRCRGHSVKQLRCWFSVRSSTSRSTRTDS